MMAEIFNFTYKKLISITPPSSGFVVYRDDKERGFILRVGHGGSKSFFLYKKIKNVARMVKIGKFPAMTIDEGRDAALALKRQIQQGQDPSSNKATMQGMVFEQLFDKYITDYAKHNTKCWRDVVQSINRNATSLKDKKILDITKQDILTIFNNMTKASPTSANRCLSQLKAIFNKAIEWELLDNNPTIRISRNKEKSRDRYITIEEKPRFFAALEQESNQLLQDFVFILLCTGVRKSNVLSMEWSNINFKDQTWHIKETKNGDPQNVVLIDKAIKILERIKEDSNSKWVFATKTGHLKKPENTWHRFCKEHGFDDLHFHDLRRTLASWMALIGTPHYIIRRLLNHNDSTATGVYTIFDDSLLRKCMEKAFNYSGREFGQDELVK